MKESRELAAKKRKKEDRGKATIFGWNIASMTSEMKVVYSILMIVIFAALFWFLYIKVTGKMGGNKKESKKDAKKKSKKST